MTRTPPLPLITLPLPGKGHPIVVPLDGGSGGRVRASGLDLVPGTGRYLVSFRDGDRWVVHAGATGVRIETNPGLVLPRVPPPEGGERSVVDHNEGTLQRWDDGDGGPPRGWAFQVYGIPFYPAGEGQIGRVADHVGAFQGTPAPAIVGKDGRWFLPMGVAPVEDGAGGAYVPRAYLGATLREEGFPVVPPPREPQPEPVRSSAWEGSPGGPGGSASDGKPAEPIPSEPEGGPGGEGVPEETEPPGGGVETEPDRAEGGAPIEGPSPDEPAEVPDPEMSESAFAEALSDITAGEPGDLWAGPEPTLDEALDDDLEDGLDDGHEVSLGTGPVEWNPASGAPVRDRDSQKEKRLQRRMSELQPGAWGGQGYVGYLYAKTLGRMMLGLRPDSVSDKLKSRVGALESGLILSRRDAMEMEEELHQICAEFDVEVEPASGTVSIIDRESGVIVERSLEGGTARGGAPVH